MYLQVYKNYSYLQQLDSFELSKPVNLRVY
jgi:hypothetical protein